MARITRKELKRNELVESFGRTVDYVSHHRRGAFEALAAAAAVLAIAVGFFLFRGWRERQAGRDLSAALEILETRLAGDPTVATAARTFPTAADREREATKHLKAASEKGGTAAGRAAQVILAARAEKPTQSTESLAKAARDGHAEVAAAAEIDAARLLAAQGKNTEAIDRLKRAIESPKSVAPKDALLFTLAETYEKAGASADARATYQRLVNDYPNSPYRADARAKVGGTP
ncbi:MAG TPA: tetratricopeptide repeat protein [Thermoanaerobaculia bacterium]